MELGNRFALLVVSETKILRRIRAATSRNKKRQLVLFGEGVTAGVKKLIRVQTLRVFSLGKRTTRRPVFSKSGNSDFPTCHFLLVI